MHAVIGRVKIKLGHEDETRAMIASHGIAMVQGMSGSSGGYWSRSADDGHLVQYSFWLFDTEETRELPRRPSTRFATCPKHPRRSSAWMCARSSDRRRGRAISADLLGTISLSF